MTAEPSHPRPTLVRPGYWVSRGDVPFRWDVDGTADRRALRAGREFGAERIVLPFPPESAASGIGRSSSTGTLWYAIPVPGEAVAAAREGGSLLVVHLEAVFGRARLWLDGHLIGTTAVSYSRQSFELDIPGDHLGPPLLVIEVEVDHHDLSLPRGKQDWRSEPHGIWYGRTSGIWRDVWFETVPVRHITDVVCTTDLATATVVVEVATNATPARGSAVSVLLAHDGETLGRAEVGVDGARVRIVVPVAALENEHEGSRLLWSPASPTLIDVVVRLQDGEGAVDEVSSYAGIREVAVRGDRFTLNGRPEFVNAVLEQYYWRDTHYTAPSDDARAAEAEIIRALGFNAARIHQLSPDPRFLSWCDRVGIMVWAELPSAYRFDATAIDAVTAEWRGIVRSSAAHPSVVTWVPFNESWGIPALAARADQRAFVLAIVHLTKAVDPTRPVISNDGWEHVESDILGYHDYSQSGAELAARFQDAASWNSFDAPGFAVAGRRGIVSPRQSPHAPLMLSEFGGVRFELVRTEDAWGYGSAADADEFTRKLGELVGAVRSVTGLAGSCYTQLTDTLQEANGLLDEARRPKVALETLRSIITRD